MTDSDFPQKGAAFSLGGSLGIFKLECKRFLRFSGWWVLLVLTSVLALLLTRLAAMQEMPPMGFFGGTRGILILPAVVCFGLLMLAVDLADHDRRYGAAAMIAARPFPAGRLVGLRFAALFALGAVASAALSALPAFLEPGGAASAYRAAATWFWGTVWLPLLAVSAAAGFAGWSLTRSFAGAIAIGLTLAAPAFAYAFFVIDPVTIYTTASQTLGVLVPPALLLGDGLLVSTWAAGLMGLAALLAGSVPARTPNSRLERAIPILGRGLWAIRVRLLGRPLAVLFSLALVAVGCLAAQRMLTSVAARQPAALAWIEGDTRRELVPLSGNPGQVKAPHIRHRRIAAEFSNTRRIAVSLNLSAAGEEPQRYAALTFGPHSRISTINRESGNVIVVENALPPTSHTQILEFSPPLTAEGAIIEVVLEPARGGERAWAYIESAGYATFEPLGPFYGDAVAVDYERGHLELVPRAAPFEVALGELGKGWAAGSAAEVQSDPLILRQTTAGWPRGLAAARWRDVSRETSLQVAGLQPNDTDPSLPLTFRVFPENADAARALHVVFERRLGRIDRVFGPDLPPVVFQETPILFSENPLAMPSATFSELTRLLPDIDDWQSPTRIAFLSQYPRVRAGIFATLFAGNFQSIEQHEFLGDPFEHYLTRIAFADPPPQLEQVRRDYLLTPWEFVRRRHQGLLRISEVEALGFEGPLLSRPAGLPPAPPERAFIVHHMLRGVLGEEAYVAMLEDLVQNRRGDSLTLSALRQSAEKAHGEALGWFFDQWLFEGVMPTYRLLEADVILSENEQTGLLEYTTRVLAVNEGTGTMPVPIILLFEGGETHRKVWLNQGEEREIYFTTRERPLVAEADPERWILQKTYLNEEGNVVEPKIFLKNVRER